MYDESGLLFEWDAYKAGTNLDKHGVSFDEAATVFRDELRVTEPDELRSETEDRAYTLGRSGQDRILVVAWTPRGRYGELVRIISARRADPREVRRYAEEPR